MKVIRRSERPIGGTVLPLSKVDLSGGFDGQAELSQLAQQDAPDFCRRLSMLLAPSFSFDPFAIPVCCHFDICPVFLRRANLAAVVRPVSCRRLAAIVSFQKRFDFSAASARAGRAVRVLVVLPPRLSTYYERRHQGYDEKLLGCPQTVRVAHRRPPIHFWHFGQ